MIYVDMPLSTNLIWLMAFLLAVAAGLALLAIYGAAKKHGIDHSATAIAMVPPIIFGAAAAVAGALVYQGVVYDLLVHGATVNAIHDAGYTDVSLHGDYFTATQGDNQVTAGLIPTGTDTYSIDIFMSGPTSQEAP